jgi:hypothetical protein
MSIGIPTKYKYSDDSVVKDFVLNHDGYLHDIMLLKNFMNFKKKVVKNTSSEKGWI